MGVLSFTLKVIYLIVRVISYVQPRILPFRVWSHLEVSVLWFISCRCVWMTYRVILCICWCVLSPIKRRLMYVVNCLNIDRSSISKTSVNLYWVVAQLFSSVYQQSFVSFCLNKLARTLIYVLFAYHSRLTFCKTEHERKAMQQEKPIPPRLLPQLYGTEFAVYLQNTWNMYRWDN